MPGLPYSCENIRMKSDIITDMISCLSICLFAAVMPIRDAVEFANSDIREERPFEIRGQVMALAKINFSIKDDSGFAFIQNSSTNEISAGDIVTVRGLFRPERGKVTYLIATDIIKEGHRPPAEPSRATLQEITSGRFDYQVVRTQGVISDAIQDEIDSRYTLITVTDGAYSAIMTWPREKDFNSILDARVELLCVCWPTYFTSRIFAPYLLVPCQGDSLRILEPPPTDWFSVDSISSLRHVNPSDMLHLGRRRATGTVMAVWDRMNVLIRTADMQAPHVKIVKGKLRGLTKLPSVGDEIELVGYPETDLFAIILTDARWRPLDTPQKGERSDESPRPVELSDLFTDSHGGHAIRPLYNGELICVEGRILKVPDPNDVHKTLLLTHGRHVISVNFGSAGDIPQDLSVNGKIKITGISVLEAELYRGGRTQPRVHGYTIVLRTPDDIVVISRPPWWTTGRLVFIICALSLVLIGILIWIRILNRLVERRGRELIKERTTRDEAELKKAERTRLAVELHDALSQNLTGIALQLDAAELTAEKNHGSDLPHLRKIRMMMQSCRDNLKNCLWDLRNLAIDQAFLSDSIRMTLSPVVGTTELSIDFPVRTRNLSDNIIHAILCMIRELAVNAVRHGKARHIDIRGWQTAAGIGFTVKDDGCGFDVGHRLNADSGHFGIQGIIERVARLNGTIDISSMPHHGTSITIQDLHEEY